MWGACIGNVGFVEASDVGTQSTRTCSCTCTSTSGAHSCQRRPFSPEGRFRQGAREVVLKMLAVMRPKLQALEHLAGLRALWHSVWQHLLAGAVFRAHCICSAHKRSPQHTTVNYQRVTTLVATFCFGECPGLVASSRLRPQTYCVGAHSETRTPCFPKKLLHKQRASG